jgi:hypothetical protein
VEQLILLPIHKQFPADLAIDSERFGGGGGNREPTATVAYSSSNRHKYEGVQKDRSAVAEKIDESYNFRF